MAQNFAHRRNPLCSVEAGQLGQAQPIRRPGDGMCGAELQPLSHPGDSDGDRRGRVYAEVHQPRGLADETLLVGILERLCDPGECRLPAQCRIGWRDVQPDATGLDPDRIARQLVSADQRGAGRQIEFPVVPVAGEHAAVGERALAQRIALVRTPIGAGEYPALGVKQEDLPAGMAHESLTLRREIIKRQRVDPGHAVPPAAGGTIGTMR